jgi:hypothetical protein
MACTYRPFEDVRIRVENFVAQMSDDRVCQRNSHLNPSPHHVLSSVPLRRMLLLSYLFRLP